MSDFVEVKIISEGTTEMTFVREIIAPYLFSRGIVADNPRIGKDDKRGGDVSFSRAHKSMVNFLKQRKNVYVSTMFDYFRLGQDWPGRNLSTRPNSQSGQLSSQLKAENLENQTLEIICNELPDLRVHERMIPYISMYEFEALLFSDSEILARNIGVEQSQIDEILGDFHNSPEEINDNPNTAPSKRLEAIKRDYAKAIDGNVIARTIGIQQMREKCPHFNAWLTRLETLKPLP